MTRRVLALDFGTSSARALVLDADAAPVPDALARHKVRLTVDDEGAAELDPRAYLDGVLRCLDELRDGGHLDGITDVVASTQWHSLVALDSSHEPLTGLLTWADTRAAAEPMPELPDPAAFHRRTGTWIHAQYWNRKAPWLLRRLGSTPALLAGLPEYVYAALVGETGASISSASGTGLFDWAKSTWDDETVERTQIPRDLLSAILPDDWTGALQQSWHQRWPQLADARWHPPLGDGAASNLGAGCIDASGIAITVGTSAAVRVVQPADEAADVPPALWRYRVDRDRVVSGVAYSAGGGLFAWAKETLQLPEAENGGDAPGLADVPIGCNGLTVLPFLAGSRAPRRVPHGSGVVSGLSLGTSPVEIVAATIESMCFEIASGLEALVGLLDDSGYGNGFDVVGGGGALENSSFWQRRLAAAIGRRLKMAEVPETAARGAAMLSLGLVDESHVPQWTEGVTASDDEITAMQEAHQRYDRLRELHGIAAAGEASAAT
jgi:gluconokinase